MKCLHCTAETTNGLALCQRCQQTLSVALVNVGSYHTDVMRIQPGERVKVRSTYKSTPPPGLNPPPDRISEATDAVDNMLSGWCRMLTEDRPTIGKVPTPAKLQATWLEHHIPTIATLEWGGELLRDCQAAERNLMRILDHADTGWYAGKCGSVLTEEVLHNGQTCACGCHDGTDYACDIPGGCGIEVQTIAALRCERGLYASPGHGYIRCPECGTNHNVDSRREVMMKEAEDTNAPVRVIARIVVGWLDEELSEERLTRRIEKWVEKGQIRDLGVRVLDGRPRRVYRIGDVLDLVRRSKPPINAEAC